MPRILIFNGTPLSTEQKIVAAGSVSYETAIKASLDSHTTKDQPLDYFMLRVADGERLPQGLTVSDFDGVWISGSPFNAYKLDQPSVQTQIDLARTIWDAGIPTFGSCWGLQVMTAALGGTVHLNPRGREIGVARSIYPTDAGREHTLYRDKAPAFDALCVHEDEVATLPTCATVLASNATSRVQAAVMAEGSKCFWGVQYHPEFDLATIAAVISTRVERHLKENLARSPQDVAVLVDDLRTIASDPTRLDLRWKYGVGPDVCDPVQRTIEFRNWLHNQVVPYAAKRA